MEKYYTPDIEEFHVGFEYEHCPFEVEDGKKDKWSAVRKFVYPDGIYNYTKMHGIEVLKSPIEKQCIRVKYLDHSDITSLGFKYVYGLKTKSDTPIDVNYGASVFKAKDKFAFGGTEYTIYYFKEDPTRIEISVNRYGHYLEDQNTLPFTVKNKFELKKLLKQLRYE